MKQDTYDYGFDLGFADGKIAAQWIKSGLDVDHGGLLSSHDPYALGYRKGINLPEGRE